MVEGSSINCSRSVREFEDDVVVYKWSAAGAECGHSSTNVVRRRVPLFLITPPQVFGRSSVAQHSILEDIQTTTATIGGRGGRDDEKKVARDVAVTIPSGRCCGWVEQELVTFIDTMRWSSCGRLPLLLGTMDWARVCCGRGELWMVPWDLNQMPKPPIPSPIVLALSKH